MLSERLRILNADYEEVTRVLASDMHLSVPHEIEGAVKRCHRLTYSLCLWPYRLKRLPPHSKPYLQEMASDAVQYIPQLLSGYSKTTSLLTRCITEDVLRHIYFKDHPIEFIRDNAVEEWHMSIKDLFEYALHHPTLSIADKKQRPIADLKTVYSELSRAVHASKVVHHEMRRALADIKMSPDAVRKHAALLERTTGAANFALMILHREQFHRWAPAERAIVLRTLPQPYRQAWLSL